MSGRGRGGDALRRCAYRVAGGWLLALLTASCWWAWMAWDDVYRTDPVTGRPSGPFEPWQVIGCGLCLVAVCVVATDRLPVRVVVPIMPVAFTGAWTLSTHGGESGGLWALGAALVLVGTCVGTVLVSGLTAVVRGPLRAVAGAGQRLRGTGSG